MATSLHFKCVFFCHIYQKQLLVVGQRLSPENLQKIFSANIQTNTNACLQRENQTLARSAHSRHMDQARFCTAHTQTCAATTTAAHQPGVCLFSIQSNSPDSSGELQGSVQYLNYLLEFLWNLLRLFAVLHRITQHSCSFVCRYLFGWSPNSRGVTDGFLAQCVCVCVCFC